MLRPVPQWKACISLEIPKLQQVWYEPVALFARKSQNFMDSV